MKEAISYAGASNPGDFLLILNWFGGYENRVTSERERVWVGLGWVRERRVRERIDWRGRERERRERERI